jgi:hypothetical protein
MAARGFAGQLYGASGRLPEGRKGRKTHPPYLPGKLISPLLLSFARNSEEGVNRPFRPYMASFASCPFASRSLQVSSSDMSKVAYT